MKENVTPLLFPYDPEDFWKRLRVIIKEEMKLASDAANQSGHCTSVTYSLPGLTQKPLFKIEEVCAIFGVTRPTIYDWIRHGKLKPFKIRSRIYFLWKDLEALWSEPANIVNH